MQTNLNSNEQNKLKRIEGRLYEDIIKGQRLKCLNINEDESFIIHIPTENAAYKTLKPMISSPHSVEHVRNGKMKVGEFRTSTISYQLHTDYNIPAIIKVDTQGGDPNWDKTSDYKTVLQKYIKDNNINFLLDIHISAPTREYDVEVGTGKLRNVKEDTNIRDLVKETLEDKYSNITCDTVFPACGKLTVAGSTFLECDIPTIQLEVNWNIIDTEEKILEFTEVIGDMLIRLDNYYLNK